MDFEPILFVSYEIDREWRGMRTWAAMLVLTLPRRWRNSDDGALYVTFVVFLGGSGSKASLGKV